MEKLTNPIKEAINLTRCFYELGVLALRETVRNTVTAGGRALECWPEDAPEDQAIPSRINQENDAA